MQVKTLKRSLAFTATWNAGVLTVTTATHYLATGNLVTLVLSNGDKLVGLTVTVTNATTFTVATDRLYAAGTVEIGFFSTGQTGLQTAVSFARSTAASGVIQSFVSGTGTAVYLIVGSLDGVHWTTLTTITHTSSNNDTQSYVVEPSWAFININITSVGAATTCTVMYAV